VSPSRLRVAVVGAGAFGGWTALALLRRGAAVTLLDAWGPGNARASSGGETRVIRGMYGPDRIYTDWVVRSFALWRENEARWGTRLYHPTGALWMFSTDDSYARASLPLLAEAGLPAEELGLAEARRRFPQVDFAGVRTVFFEREAGYLAARRACHAVADAVAAEGGEVREAAVRPGPLRGGAMGPLELAGGGALAADVYVFACGPWLGALFPEVVGERVRPTRQEVFFFGTPAGDGRFGEESCPLWIDFDERIFYGIPGNEARGFKVADDTRGEPIDPTTAERTPTPEPLARARALLARRFPGLANAPLVEARVCQYENSPDGNFLVDRHPHAGNVWLLGGGSGHGFKLGPALGEHAADLVLGRVEPLAAFSLERLPATSEMPPESQFSAGLRRKGDPL
jgi:glycine/D-amino acid oxidase-like deaminating enzyme